MSGPIELLQLIENNNQSVKCGLRLRAMGIAPQEFAIDHGSIPKGIRPRSKRGQSAKRAAEGPAAAFDIGRESAGPSRSDGRCPCYPIAANPNSRDPPECGSGWPRVGLANCQSAVSEGRDLVVVTNPSIAGKRRLSMSFLDQKPIAQSNGQGVKHGHILVHGQCPHPSVEAASGLVVIPASR